MKFVIVGCGRVGSTLAENLDAAGHEVVIIDVRTAAFDRLPETFRGLAVRGDGTDEDVLRRAGAEGADTFLALTEGDNRNVMASQVAAEALAIPHVICKINDPVRSAAYADLGLVTLCRTNLMVDAVAQYMNLPIQPGPGIDLPTMPLHAHPHPDASPAGEATATAEAGGAAMAEAGGAAMPGNVRPESRASGSSAQLAGVAPGAGQTVQTASDARAGQPARSASGSGGEAAPERPASTLRGLRRWRG